MKLRLMKPRALSLLGLLTLATSCSHSSTSGPLYAGAPEKRESEHLFAYSVDEALEATRGLLKDLGYAAFPYRDSNTELLTAWRFNGRSVSSSFNSTTE